VPRAEQVADALHAIVEERLGEARRPAERPGHRTGGHRAGHVLGVADPLGEHAAEPGVGQHPGLTLYVPGELDDGGGPGGDGLERGHLHHEVAFFALEQARGRDGQVGGVGEAEVLVEAARDDRPHVRVAVDEAGEERLSAPVVLLGPGVGGEDLVGRTDGRDEVALDRERHVVLDGVGVRDGGVGEHDCGGLLRRRPRAGPRRRPQRIALEQQGGRARSRTGQPLATGQMAGAAGCGCCRDRVLAMGCRHDGACTGVYW